MTHSLVEKDHFMFGLFKSDPVKKHTKAYEKVLEEAVHAQRAGDIRL
jgi:hypothetical protein